MKTLKFLYTERYGGGHGCVNGDKAIDKHVSRVYEDEQGNTFILDRDLSFIPPCFEALGPIPKEFKGIAPLIKINGDRYFADGLSWKKAIKIFLNAVNNP
jgi:hypothetical protein